MIATALAVLLGHHVSYSASPAMLNAAFAATGRDARYELRDVAPAELPQAVDDLRNDRALGGNVTQPHKLAVCALLDDLDPVAQRLGAVNTIVRRNGALVGHNTDLPALVEELRGLLGDGTRPRHAIVLGAGGAARAATAALAEVGVDQVTSLDRRRWDEMEHLLREADVLVHATPIGTASDASPVPAALLHRGLAVLDLVYRPTPTRLVRDALAHGAVVRGGAGMLLRQAAASYSLWIGEPAPWSPMRDALAVELGATIDA